MDVMLRLQTCSVLAAVATECGRLSNQSKVVPTEVFLRCIYKSKTQAHCENYITEGGRVLFVKSNLLPPAL